MAEEGQSDLAALTVQLLSAYVSNNTVPSDELPGLIESTRKALSGEVKVTELTEPVHEPAVTIRKSLASRDHILSLIDGKPYKALKRHLAANGLSPEEYRARYNLADDYPMVAPAYSELRRATAQRLGLGRKKAESAVSPVPTTDPVSTPGPEKTKKRRGPTKVAVAKTETPKDVVAPAEEPAVEKKPRRQTRIAKAALKAKVEKVVDGNAPRSNGRRRKSATTPPQATEPGANTAS